MSILATSNSRLQAFILADLEETGKVLGKGAYGEVAEMRLHGVVVAAKRIHDLLLSHNSASQVSALEKRFEDECIRLSRIRHPNIVQFLGVCFRPRSSTPMLVMECLPMSLALCLDRYKVIPNRVKASVLLDIANGLYYLHRLTPPISHRDLTANNVLLTHGMKAKITDFGVSRIFDPDPAKLYVRLSGCPGNICHMPPEAQMSTYCQTSENFEKLDVFSFGNIILHVCTHRWPEPSAPFNESTRPKTEIERRQHLLDMIDTSCPLRQLAIDCLHNSPCLRVSIVTLVDALKQYIGSGLPTAIENASNLGSKVKELKQANLALQKEAKYMADKHVGVVHQMELVLMEARTENGRLRQIDRDKQKRIDQLNASFAQIEGYSDEISNEKNFIQQSYDECLAAANESAKALEQYQFKLKEMSDERGVLMSVVSLLKQTIQRNAEESDQVKCELEQARSNLESMAEEKVQMVHTHEQAVEMVKRDKEKMAAEMKGDFEARLKISKEESQTHLAQRQKELEKHRGEMNDKVRMLEGKLKDAICSRNKILKVVRVQQPPVLAQNSLSVSRSPDSGNCEDFAIVHHTGRTQSHSHQNLSASIYDEKFDTRKFSKRLSSDGSFSSDETNPFSFTPPSRSPVTPPPTSSTPPTARSTSSKSIFTFMSSPFSPSPPTLSMSTTPPPTTSSSFDPPTSPHLHSASVNAINDLVQPTPLHYTPSRRLQYMPNGGNGYFKTCRSCHFCSRRSNCSPVTKDKHLCKHCMYCSQCKRPFTAENIASAVNVHGIYMHFKCK